MGSVYAGDMPENRHILRAILQRESDGERIAITPEEEAIFGYILKREVIFKHGLSAVDQNLHLRFDLGVMLFIRRVYSS